MRKLLAAALFASAVSLSAGTAVAGHCFDGDPGNGELPPDWDCDIWHSADVSCPALASLSPGVPGVVDIDSEGDVSIAGTLFWDCPPYGS